VNDSRYLEEIELGTRQVVRLSKTWIRIELKLDHDM
jgi:hypothetical protein